MSVLLTGAEVDSLTSADPALGPAVRLLAESVPASCAGLVAYHASGYPAFLAAALAPPTDRRTVLLRQVRTGAEPHAVADWRLLGQQLFLNGIAVRQHARGQGHGTRLLRDGLALARRLGCATMALDVSHDNVDAHRLYQRMGFVDQSSSVWTNIPTPAPSAADTAVDVRLLDWPSYAAHQATYGFGDLHVSTGGVSVTVRVVGTALRLPPETPGPALVPTLAAVLPASRCYVIGPDAPGPEVFARFTRMCRPISEQPTR